jgi:putative oxygen-independent coproporphyrinogen III oxidase
LPPELWKRAGFALYLHWPFCQAKCPYCDFNSHVSLEINQDRWADAYCSEIKRAAVETKGRVLSSVFFGGGTPSLMTPETVARILECVRQSWPMSNDPEITLEANPTSVEAKRFQGFRDAGVTRISMGIQALNNDDLKRLGRLHTVEEARSAFETARSLFDRVSFDLIYARQGQSLNAWTDELKQALSMAVDHLSLYQLTRRAGDGICREVQEGQSEGSSR